MTSKTRFDVVIVGARCAGSALGIWLARAGASVLAVDRDPLPSDQVLSTHTIHPPGVDLLDDLGVGDAVREVTPASPRMRVRKGDAWADLTFQNGRAELCPRRKRLDGLLQAGAEGAGVEVRDRTRATRILFDGRQVVGVEVERQGVRERLHADLVVGADGRRSFVASAVGAEEYLAYDAPRAMYWSYWRAPRSWRSDAYPFDMYLAHVGAYVRAIFQTDDDRLLVGSLPPVREAASWREDPGEALMRNLAQDDVVRSLLGDEPPAEPVRGTVKERYFFRRAAGDGWALVGDAGHHKDFVVGDGITEALIQAKGLSQAISRDDPAALTEWWRGRDVRALPTYFWGQDEGALGEPTELESIVVSRVGRSERLKALMTRLPEHQCTPYDALPPSAILPAILGAVLRGHLGVIPEFAAQAKRVGAYKRELAERKRLLEQARRRSSALPRRS